MAIAIFKYCTKTSPINVHVVHLYRYGKPTSDIVVNFSDVVQCVGQFDVKTFLDGNSNSDSCDFENRPFVHWSELFDVIPKSVNWPEDTVFVKIQTLISLQDAFKNDTRYCTFVDWLNASILSWIRTDNCDPCK
ncbi:unnamed protein product [Macrosiphum euphorbiae]|uniref:Uncharacterized protein n=1 Tax=Macrosiphum euphorbiae TaxID=13131 RepID=A0AAV0XSC6_9HEMI|nr:unnamed protein product [Macrosiphum euphorbiae]